MAISLKTILKNFNNRRFIYKVGEWDYFTLIDDDAHRIYFDVNYNELYDNIKEVPPMNIKGIVEDIESYNGNSNMIVIDKKEVQDFKKNKENKNKPYIFENAGMKYGVNPQYLIESMDYVGSNEIYFTTPKRLLMCHSDDWSRVAIFLPVSIK